VSPAPVTGATLADPAPSAVLNLRLISLAISSSCVEALICTLERWTVEAMVSLASRLANSSAVSTSSDPFRRRPPGVVAGDGTLLEPLLPRRWSPPDPRRWGSAPCDAEDRRAGLARGEKRGDHRHQHRPRHDWCRYGDEVTCRLIKILSV
jgi:hypothetical protein